MEYGSVHPETRGVDSAMRSRVCRTSTSQEELQDLPQATSASWSVCLPDIALSGGVAETRSPIRTFQMSFPVPEICAYLQNFNQLKYSLRGLSVFQFFFGFMKDHRSCPV